MLASSFALASAMASAFGSATGFALTERESSKGRSTEVSLIFVVF